MAVVLLCCRGDTDPSDYKGEYNIAASGDDFDDVKEYEPDAKYSPYYGGGGGHYMMGVAKGSDSDTFV